MSFTGHQGTDAPSEHASEDNSNSGVALPSLSSSDAYGPPTGAYAEPETHSQELPGIETDHGSTTAKTGHELVDLWAPSGAFELIDRASLSDVEFKSQCLRAFWEHQLEAVQAMSLPRVQPLPPKRIRRIVKYDEDVQNATQRVSKEVVELFGKAAELFVAELSLVSWMNVATTKKIMQVSHISNAVAEYHTYDFLSGIVPEPTANKPKRTRRKRATTTSNTEVAHSAVELPVGEQEGAASVSSPFPPPQASSPFPPSGPSSSSSHLHLQDGGDPSSVATPTASPLDLHHLQHLQQQHALSLNSRHSAQEDTEEIHHQGEHVHQQLADDDELTATPTHFPSHLYDMPVQSPLTSMPTAPSRAHFSTMNIDASNTGM